MSNRLLFSTLNKDIPWRWCLLSERKIKYDALRGFLNSIGRPYDTVETMKANFSTPDQPYGSGLVEAAKRRMQFALKKLSEENALDNYDVICCMENGILDHGDKGLFDVNITFMQEIGTEMPSCVYGISNPVPVPEEWHDIVRKNVDYSAEIVGAPIKLGKLMAEKYPNKGIDPNNWFASIEGCPDRQVQIVEAIEAAWAKRRLIGNLVYYKNFPNDKCPCFEDVMALFATPYAATEIAFHMYSALTHLGFIPDIIVGPELKGCMLAIALATQFNINRHGPSIVFPRKKGKLPGQLAEVSYGKEYGPDILEFQTEPFRSDKKVVIIDDVIATGGTLNALVGKIIELGISAENIHVIVLREIEPLRDVWQAHEHLRKTTLHVILGAGIFWAKMN